MNWVQVPPPPLHRTIISTVKRGELVSDRMLYIILRGHWYDIIVLTG
jgi:hypothetical protein